MEPNETEGKAPDEQSPGARTPGMGAGRPRNWTLIALIAVSCVAVLLLAATVALAITAHDDRGARGPGDRRMFERAPRGPMMKDAPGRRMMRDFDDSCPCPPGSCPQQPQPEGQPQPEQSSPGT